MKYIIAVLLLTTIPAMANAQHAVYGVGAETCQVALVHDWVKGGEVSWIGGFMTAGSMATPKHDIFPDHSTRELIGLVREKCQATPLSTLGFVTESVMFDLWDAQQAPKGEKF
jgi:hypothetical protein